MKISIKRAAQELGVSIDTLRRRDRLGILKADKLPSSHRRYNLKEIKEFYNRINVER